MLFSVEGESEENVLDLWAYIPPRVNDSNGVHTSLGSEIS
jgi:hypothetical protein